MRTLQTCFLTGANGFVGANLTRLLLEEGCEVRVLVRPESDLSSLQGLDIDVRHGDLLDPASLARHVEGCDTCFHLAAAISTRDLDDLYRVNVDGSRAVLEAAVAAGCASIVHTSTMGTLGRKDGSPARETDSYLAPNASDYAKSKFRAESEALGQCEKGAPIIIVHPSAPVGPWDRVPTVTGRRIVEVLEGKLPRWIPGKINHVAVKDVARGMVLAARNGKPGMRYLLACEEGNLTRDDFVQLVARVSGVRPPRSRRRLGFLSRLRRKTSRENPSGPVSLACNPSWTVKELGLPQTSLEEAFREAVQWFRDR
jgi:dihydroflavonol-4-reductase